MRLSFLVLMTGGLLTCVTGCTSSFFNVRAKQPYRYELKYGESVILRNGYAIVPKHAPPAVHRIVAAGNKIKGFPSLFSVIKAAAVSSQLVSIPRIKGFLLIQIVFNNCTIPIQVRK